MENVSITNCSQYDGNIHYMTNNGIICVEKLIP